MATVSESEKLNRIQWKVADLTATELRELILASCRRSNDTRNWIYDRLHQEAKSESPVVTSLENLASPSPFIKQPQDTIERKAPPLLHDNPFDIDVDDFDLSPADEAELLQLSQGYESSSSLKKRKSQDMLGNTVNKKRKDMVNSPASAMAHEVLRNRFQLNDFRLEQLAAIVRLLEGGSSVVVFPTGGGKSLCYQLPALCFKQLDKLSGQRQGSAEGGITLVVSPLIALMKDQVDALKRRGISAAVLDSTKSKEEYLATTDQMRHGTLDILYCAPERLNNEGFVASMANVRGGVRLLAVDEAHCISEWGHAFRPDYLKVARFSKEIHAERVVCLTATATPQVAKDVREAFDIPQEGLFRTSTYRSNLHLHAKSYQTKKESYPELRKFLESSPGPTIIYVTLQKHTEALSSQLRQHRFETAHFHAGMQVDEKMRTQDAFMASSRMIIVATIAFGMGVDKANIRNVVHYDIPRSIEGYSQEIGRAGRDGQQSQCMLLLCAEDLHLKESFARGDLPSKKSVSELLREVFSSQPSEDPQPLIEFSLYYQARQFDIKPTVLNNIYAQLELRFDLLRATTPKYTKYTYKQIATSLADKSPAGTAILNTAKTAKTLTHIDIDVTVQRSGIPRAEIVAKLNEWHDRRLIDLSTSGVLNVYRVMKKLPSTSQERQKIIDALYHELELREQQDLQRGNQVIDLITGTTCFSRALAQHFGDALPDGRQECGHCTICETKTPVPKVTPPKRDWNSKAFKKVLAICPDRDDPRFLARVAFGIGSPRVTAAKLSGSPVFGSMEDHNFMSLLAAFKKVCHEP